MAGRFSQSGIKRPLRLLLLLAFLFLTLLILLIVLQLTESALSIWQLLDQMSPSLVVFYGMGLIGIGLLIALVAWFLLKPSHAEDARKKEERLQPIERESLDRALEDAQQRGIDTASAQRELHELERRVEQAKRYVAFFGPVSCGKSSLIKAITGESRIKVDPRCGTTRQVEHYAYSKGGTSELILTDAPGILDLDTGRVTVAREEARRADLIVYVCDGELTRDQFTEIRELQRYERPLLLALNKPDRYSEKDLLAILQRLAEQLPDVEQVVVQAGGKETLLQVDADGREVPLERDRMPQVEALLAAIVHRFEIEAPKLARLRDESLMRLGAEKLAEATSHHRLEQSERLVKRYARKAMLGAMAAVSPGTDVLIQGYFGIQMVRELTQLYEVRVHQADLDEFIALASRQVGKRMTLLLALAGNVLKAFPGIGTVTGGLMHAVAYGMIFEGLGKAVAKTLHESGELQQTEALNYFEESVSGDLEGRAKDFARLAWQEFAAKKQGG
jgi:small GTP-binding protein